MSANNYIALDEAIVEAIRAGKHPLYAANVCSAARAIAEASGREGMRVIDGRLQALRRARRITANRKADAGWVLSLDAEEVQARKADHLSSEVHLFSDEFDVDETIQASGSGNMPSGTDLQ